MVYYIRYLKLPLLSSTTLKGNQAIVKALVTITTDLGDDFYPDSLDLTATIAPARIGGGLNDPISATTLTWQAGMRSLSVGIVLPNKYSADSLEICISDGAAEELRPAHIPRIVGVWGEVCITSKGGSASRMVERRFCLGNDTLLSIREEAGESIARHLW